MKQTTEFRLINAYFTVYDDFNRLKCMRLAIYRVHENLVKYTREFGNVALQIE